MLIYVVKLKSLIRSAVTILAVVIFLLILTSGGNNIPVFSQTREIPIYSVETASKVVSLTFDCAWGADDIPQILEILRKENVKASFFLVGTWAERFPDAVRSIDKEGHDIANHGYTHLRLGALDSSRIKTDIGKCGEVLNKLTGKKPDLFRPPYGDYTNNVVAIARDLGYYTIQWDVDSLDWKPGASGEYILKRVTQRAKSGSIMLFHNDTPNTAAILPQIIKTLKNGGYKFVLVSELIIRENYTINNEGRQIKK